MRVQLTRSFRLIFAIESLCQSFGPHAMDNDRLGCFMSSCATFKEETERQSRYSMSTLRRVPADVALFRKSTLQVFPLLCSLCSGAPRVVFQGYRLIGVQAIYPCRVSARLRSQTWLMTRSGAVSNSLPNEMTSCGTWQKMIGSR